MKKILLVAGAALALAGCGEKGEFEKAINAKIGQDNSVVLDGFIEQGLMVFEQGYDSNVLGITEEGKKAKVWSTTDGACVGRRAVDEIKEWTEPGNGNQKVVRVSYTWKLVDVPGWIDKKAFASVKGMNDSADGAMNLVKTSNGWRAN
ncbi:lipoprotein [Escherichia coli]|uniref:lipoprotein n=1 Tax=Escherichia coli TaxID=562 RepID=UPI00063D0D05|nr:lipoprotein [Escherichia coli]KLH84169.1 hypothetical protein WR18_25515 [Escherichia coli]